MKRYFKNIHALLYVKEIHRAELDNKKNGNNVSYLCAARYLLHHGQAPVHGPGVG